MEDYQALVLVSFGAPERRQDVMPFLERVTAGRGISPSRIAAVAEHYYAAGGASPLNARCRELMEALRTELAHLDLRLYWGNRNWHPFLDDTMAEMRDDHIERALAFVTSAYGGYSSCRQYLDDIEQARRRVGDGAPAVDKLRLYYNHPGWVQPWAAQLQHALEPLGRPADGVPVRDLHCSQRAGRPGCDQPLRGTPDGNGETGGGRGGCRALAARLAEPFRAAQLALAGA